MVDTSEVPLASVKSFHLTKILRLPESVELQALQQCPQEGNQDLMVTVGGRYLAVFNNAYTELNALDLHSLFRNEKTSYSSGKNYSTCCWIPTDRSICESHFCYIAAGTVDGEVQIIDLANLRVCTVLNSCHKSKVNAVACVPGKEELVITAASGEVKVWNWADEKLITTITLPNVNSLCIDPENPSTLLMGSSKGLYTCELSGKASINQKALNCLVPGKTFAFATFAGSRIAAVSRKGEAVILKSTGDKLSEFLIPKVPSEDAYRPSVSLDGRFLISGTTSGGVYVYDLKKLDGVSESKWLTPSGKVDGAPRSVLGCYCTTDGEYILGIVDDGIHRWTYVDPKLIDQYEAEAEKREAREHEREIWRKAIEEIKTPERTSSLKRSPLKESKRLNEADGDESNSKRKRLNFDNEDEGTEPQNAPAARTTRRRRV